MRRRFADWNIEFEDEMRIGTRTELGRKWTPIGVRPVGKPRIGYKYTYLYVSLQPFTGRVFALFLPRLDKECFKTFLVERNKGLGAATLMVADGAGAHRLKAEETGVIELTKLSPYSPELKCGGAVFPRVAPPPQVSSV